MYGDKPKMHGKPWNKQDTEYIKTEWERGYSIGFIAKLVERIPSAVFMKLCHTGVIEDYSVYGFLCKSDIYEGNEYDIANIVNKNISDTQFFSQRMGFSDLNSSDTIVGVTLNFNNNKETTMDNKRKKVVVRMWCY